MRRGVRIFGHPAHPPLTHLPIGLLVATALWDAVALGTGHPIWWALSFWSMALGLVATLPAAATGLVDYAAIPGDDPASAPGFNHMLVMLGAVGTYTGSLFVRGGPAPPAGGQLAWALVLNGAGLLLLTVGGWLGGHLVYHHGVGQRQGVDQRHGLGHRRRGGRSDDVAGQDAAGRPGNLAASAQRSAETEG